MDHDMSVGQRIRYWRKRRGPSQATLAELIGRSESWLEKVERGERTADRFSDLLKIANVLKIGLGDLIGGVELPPNGGQPHDPPRGMHAVRRAIFAGRPPDREPPSIKQLRAAVERSQLLHGDGFYERVTATLPNLLDDCRAAAAHEAPEAWWCLAATYQGAVALANTFGDAALACAAAQMAIVAAEHSDDPLMVARSRQKLASALIYQGWFDAAGAVCSDAADAIAPTDATTRAGWSMWGSLHFNAATAAVRSDDITGAWKLLRASSRAAEEVGPGHNDYWECFTPASVDANKVMVALESGDPVEALRIAKHAQVEEMPNKWRRARFFLDVAQAWKLRHDDAAAVIALQTAEEHAPEVIRYSVKARELVRVCLKRERKTLTPGLRPLAERLKVTV